MFKGRNDWEWEEMWIADKKSVLDTMVSNMASDLSCGYDYFGKSITGQREAIIAYKNAYEEQLMLFAVMDEKAVQKWCYYDMVRRGVIE